MGAFVQDSILSILSTVRSAARPVLLLVAAALVAAGAVVPAQVRAQPDRAAHTVTIVVEKTTRIDLSDDLRTTVKQGTTQTLTTTYSVYTNRAEAQVVTASATGSGVLTGLEVTAEMAAPDDESVSTGPKTLLTGGDVQTKTLLENLKGASASNVDLTYQVSASPQAPPGRSSISITYTVSTD